ncbi:transglycosylase SLT domain-containing protein [Dongia sp.]|uniref:transglycosylase SLT domain-containing protein n=1 Tax=Dongia sp. TaxID=1977262 RepID=UPI00375032EC
MTWRWASAALLAAMIVSAPAAAQQGADEALHDAGAPAQDYVAESLLPANDVWTGDLDGMQERKRIRILVPFSKTFYFIDKGKQYGITYDLGTEFGIWLNKRIKSKKIKVSIVFVPVPRDKLFTGLVEGLGDIAAGNLTITDRRSDVVDFGHPLATGAREILVTGPGSPEVKALADLGGQELFVRQSSSYWEHLETQNKNLASLGKTPITLMKVDEELEDEDIMEMVNAGLLPWAVVDERKAKLWSPLFTSMQTRSDVVIHDGGEIAWAFRKNSPLLKEVVDAFCETHKIGTKFGNILKKRYIGAQSPAHRATSKEELANFQRLVALFRTYGQQYKFDALMIAAQGYQESQLNQKARSKRGAVGIMQVMPATAADPAIGITGIDKDPDKNIHAGVKYLRLLVEKYLDDPAIDDKNRTLLAFAAYNAGPGNLRKFRAVAAKSGLDPNVWFGNVEHGAAKVVGRETVEYVANIYVYYVAYRLATERDAMRKKAAPAIPVTGEN